MGASSIGQWPDPLTITSATLVATNLDCVISIWPDALSPVSTSMGIVNGVLANCQKFTASCGKPQ